MISIQRIGLQHLIAACAASLSLACSSSSGTPATGGGTDSGGENDATTTPPSDTGTGEPETSTTTPPADAGADTSSGEAGPAALSCTSYCAAIMSACTGANAQYQTGTDECMNACANFPLGMAGDTSGNTLGCRMTHAGYAATTPNPHCWHAGPFGYGGCGDECEGFCTLATTWCTPDGGFDAGAPPYASNSACLTACAGFVQIDSADAGVGLDGGFFAMGPAGGNTLDCREYHLGNALTSSANQQVHCPHPAATSATCN